MLAFGGICHDLAPHTNNTKSSCAMVFISQNLSLLLSSSGTSPSSVGITSVFSSLGMRLTHSGTSFRTISLLISSSSISRLVIIAGLPRGSLRSAIRLNAFIK